MKKAEFKEWIIKEDEDFIFINKPPFLASLEDRAKPGLNINVLAKEYWAEAQLCHRLDKETSGILAIAKHPEAYRHMSMQFEHREVAKRYHAVVEGIQDLDGIVVNLPILPLTNGTVKIDKAEGKQAETIFFTKQVYKNHTLVECLPITGRMHQIRIHLSCVNAPIVADLQYGGKEVYLSEFKKKKFNLKKDTEEQPLIKRVALHSYSLTYTDLKGEQQEVVAEYPKDFKVLVKKLEEFA